ncbi:MAG: hypothetical protein Q7R64_01930 [bacterium]|nr:hypothetical protein [bacterium]
MPAQKFLTPYCRDGECTRCPERDPVNRQSQSEKYKCRCPCHRRKPKLKVPETAQDTSPVPPPLPYDLRKQRKLRRGGWGWLSRQMQDPPRE